MDMRVKDPHNLSDLDCENIERSANSLSEQFGVDHWFEWTVMPGDRGQGEFSYSPKNVPQVPIVFDTAADLIIEILCEEYGLTTWKLA